MGKKHKKKKKKQQNQGVQLDDVKNMTVGSVQELMPNKESKEENTPKEESLAERLKNKVAMEQAKTEETDNHILSQYIQAHKSNYEGPSWEEGVGVEIVSGKVKSLEEVGGKTVEKPEKQPPVEEVKQEEKLEEKVEQEIPTPVVEEKVEETKKATDVEEEKVIEPIKELVTSPITELEQSPVTEDTEYLTPHKSDRRKKIVILAVSAAVLAGVGYVGYNAYQDSQAKQRTLQMAKDKTALENLEKEIPSFYFDKEQHFIKSEKLKDIASFVKKFNALKGTKGFETVQPLIEQLKQKAKITQDVNLLFTKNAFENDKIVKDLVLAKYKAVTLTSDTKDTAFDTVANQAIDEAKKQYDTAKKADEATKKLESDTKNLKADEESVKKALEQVQSTGKLIKEIKNESIRNDFQKKLDKVNEEIQKKKAELEKAQKAQAASQANDEKTSEETVASEENSSQTTPAETPQAVPQIDGGATENGGVGDVQNASINNMAQAGPEDAAAKTDSIIPYSSRAIADTHNEAWAWAEGIQERVINICISRGYIASTGWYLNPVDIINGNGYYNLIAADGHYLVTINCKTGWFRGRGTIAEKGYDFDPNTAVHY